MTLRRTNKENELEWMLVIQSGAEDMGNEVDFYETEAEAKEAAEAAVGGEDCEHIAVYVSRVLWQNGRIG